MSELENNYSAQEHVFSIPDLRLYILQYAIGKYPKRVTCRKKIKEKVDNIIFDISFKILSCFYPSIHRHLLR